MFKRSYWVAILGAAGCLVLLLCIGTTAFAGYFLYRNASSSLPINRIAYVDNNMDIQVVNPQGGQRVAITTDAAGSSNHAHLFPAWSLDSKHIAFISLSGDANQEEGSLDVAPTSGGHLTTIYKSQSDLPFYAYWSPDNQRLAFLTQNDQNQTLMLASADGKGGAQKLGDGSPLYWAWSPDGRTMLTHVGGTRSDSPDAHISLIFPQANQPPQDLSAPGSFMSPQFSPDGSAILYASSDGTGGDSLYRADSRGKNPQLIQSFSGQIAFAWSPDGNKIATLVTPADAQLPNQGPITVSDGNGKHPKQVVKEDALAFYWSPDSKQLAYLTIASPDNKLGCASCEFLGKEILRAVSNAGAGAALSSQAFGARPIHGLGAPLGQSQTVSLSWRVVDVPDGQPRTLAIFEPTDTFLAVLPFFDQYSRSLTFWSPDSRSFVYAKSENSTDGSVWVVDATAGSPPRRIADGTLAVWSWR